MGRRERALDPSASPVAAFANGLRILRQQAGSPPYRQMAQKAGFSASALASAAAGQDLPSLDLALAYVAACGDDTTAWEQRWVDTKANLTDDHANQVATKSPRNLQIVDLPRATPSVHSFGAEVAQPTIHDPSRKGLLETLATQLRDLRLRAGNPSLRALERDDLHLKKTTLSNVLNANTNPTLDCVLRFVKACNAHAELYGFPIPADERDPEHWRDEWMHLQRALSAHRRKKHP